MNPFGVSGLFQSTADQRQNSFQDPMSLSRLYPGWGMNPAYQTPAYDAPYRPQYSGPNAYTAYGPTGFWKGLGNLGGTALGMDTPYWGNPISNYQDSFNAVGQTPFDAGMRIGQRFIAPAVAIGVADAVMGKWAANQSRLFAGGMMSKMGIGPGRLMSMGTGAAGFVGGFAIPFAVGTAVAHAVDTTMFQPYARSRMMGQVVQDSFAGVTLADGGNRITGRGLSSYQSARIGSAIDMAGIKDMTFSASQFNGIASMGMRAGLFDDVGGQSDIVRRASSIAAQVKTILAISRDPNIANAVEELSKLRMAGASISGGAFSQAATAYRGMGMYASIAGTSVQRLMSESGMQGQYMFQMNGMVPFMGQLAAGNAFSSFAVAQRVGVLSNATLARMGGVSGAAQSALGAQLTEQSTMFAKMQMFNKYITGGSTNGVVNTVSAFGANASRDPVGTLGSMILNGGALASIDSQNPAATEQRMVQLMQSMGMQRGADGKFSDNQLAAVLQSTGMPPEQIIAYINMRKSQTNPETLAISMKAIKAQTAEQVRQVIDQENLGAGLGGRLSAWISRGWKDVKGALAQPAYAVSRAGGSAADAIGMAWDSWMYGRTIDEQKADMVGDYRIDMNGIAKHFPDYRRSTLFSNNKAKDSTAVVAIAEELNRSANGGGNDSELARKILRFKGDFSSTEAKELLGKFLQGSDNPALRKAYDSLQGSSKVFDDFQAAVKGNVVANNKPAGVSDKATPDEISIMNQALDIHKRDGPVGLMIDDFLSEGKYSNLARSMSGLSKQQKIDRINELTIKNLRARGQKIGNGSYESVRSLLAAVDAGTSAETAALKNSATDIAYSKDLLQGGKLISQAGGDFAVAVDKFKTAIQGMPGYHNSSGQRSAGER